MLAFGMLFLFKKIIIALLTLHSLDNPDLSLIDRDVLLYNICLIG